MLLLFMWFVYNLYAYVYKYASERSCVCMYMCSCIVSMSNQKKSQILAAYTWYIFSAVGFSWFSFLFGFYVCVCVYVYVWLFVLFYFLAHFIYCEALFLNHVGSDKKTLIICVFCMVLHLILSNELLHLGHTLISSASLEPTHELRINGNSSRYSRKERKTKSELLRCVAIRANILSGFDCLRWCIHSRITYTHIHG